MTKHIVNATFANGTTVHHEFPTAKYTLDQVRAFTIIGQDVKSCTQMDVTLADGRCTSWRRGHGWSAISPAKVPGPWEEYERLSSRESKQAWFDSHKESLRADKHVQWRGQDNPYGRRVHHVTLSATAQQWCDQLLIDWVDGGPYNFGGSVKRSDNPAEVTVTVYID